MKSPFKAERGRDGMLRVSRFLLMLLFLIFGWTELTGYHETVTLFAHLDVPLPTLATLIAIAAEVDVGLVLVAGLFTRPLALLMEAYTCATSVLGHHYWSLAGSVQSS